MQKTGIIITLVIIAVLAAGIFIFSQFSYKICWRCNADQYFIRGTEYTCNDKQSYRQTGLKFIERAAGLGHTRADLLLAELYSSDLPAGYALSNTEQKECLQEDVTPDQTTGTSYFTSVIAAVEKGEEVAPETLNNLALLYLEGIVATDNANEKAGRLYEKAAAAGDLLAMSQLGTLSNDQGYYPKAMRWLVKAAENPTDFVSPLMIGDYYMYGKGVVINYQKAEEWYNKALSRSGKSDQDKDDTGLGPDDVVLARLEMVQRKLADNGQKQRMTINYSIDGGVKHFIIYTTNHPESPVGEVINDNGNIHATMNETLAFTSQLPEPRQENFSSMNEGMRWVLNTFAMNTHEDAANLIFDFVLTNS